MQEISGDVVIIGGGPAGYVAAIRAGQLGLRTILVEEGVLGGTCLNIGCIPSKALIHAAEAFYRIRHPEEAKMFGLSVNHAGLDFEQTQAWKNSIVNRLTNGISGLLRKSRVAVIFGKAEIQDGKTVLVQAAEQPVRIRALNLVVATGSKPAAISAIPFGGNVISSTEALSLKEIPSNLIVIGAGYIGLELGTAFAKLGSAVTVVEAADRILPAWDSELTRPVAKRLEELGVQVMTSARARQFSRVENKLLVERRDEQVELSADKILVAIGREPGTEGFGLESLDLTMDGKFVKVSDRCETSMSNVWAIGDVTGEPMLAHRAMAQGALVAEIIGGSRRSLDNVAIPSICFTDPEILSVGLTPEQARTNGEEIKVGMFPFAANGRAMTQLDDTGFVRLVARSNDNLVLGAQAVGAGVSELSSSFSMALEMGAVLEDVAAMIQAHPTRSEAIQEAALRMLGHGLHI